MLNIVERVRSLASNMTSGKTNKFKYECQGKAIVQLTEFELAEYDKLMAYQKQLEQLDKERRILVAKMNAEACLLRGKAKLWWDMVLHRSGIRASEKQHGLHVDRNFGCLRTGLVRSGESV